MLEVEGGDEATCLKILRHEAGHAIDNAYQLRRRQARRELFGLPSTPYPEYYTPKPYSKSFVQHLDHWYAQSHPDEDFAETFATWLTPDADWQTRYVGWPAERKLHYMDRLMASLARTPPKVDARRARSNRCAESETTLREHYRGEARTLRPRLTRLLRRRPAATCSPTTHAMRRTCPLHASCNVSAVRCAARWPASPTATSTPSTSLSTRSSGDAASSDLRLADDRRDDPSGLHGVPHRPDDELPAQRPAQGGAVSCQAPRAGAGAPASRSSGHLARRRRSADGRMANRVRRRVDAARTGTRGPSARCPRRPRRHPPRVRGVEAAHRLQPARGLQRRHHLRSERRQLSWSC